MEAGHSHQLLSDFLRNLFFYRIFRQRPLRSAPMPVLETVARFKDKPLDFVPGQGFHYSDSGYLLLGYVVEQASGGSYP